MQPRRWLKNVFFVFLLSMPCFFFAGYFLNTYYFVYILPFEKIKKAEIQKIEKAVEYYNKMVMDVYVSKGSAAVIDSIPASREMRHKLFMDEGYLRLTGRVLVYDLAEMTIEKVEMSGPFFAEVFTGEEWNYVYKDPTMRRELSEIKGMTVGLRYVLRKQDGTWLVVNASPYRKKA